MLDVWYNKISRLRGRGWVKQERNLAFDVMNILACIGVVALHHNGLAHSYDGGSAGWVQSLAVECLFYCSVPIFMMLSGANLLGYRDRYGTAAFFKKRFLRTVVPWLFWSVVFLIWKLRTGDLRLDPLTWRTCADAILNSKVMSVYWFFPALFVCYLAMPILSMARNDRKLLWYAAGVLFLFYSVKPAAALWLTTYCEILPLVAMLTCAWAAQRMFIRKHRALAILTLTVPAALKPSASVTVSRTW